jgi:hypothetical protein
VGIVRNPGSSSTSRIPAARAGSATAELDVPKSMAQNPGMGADGGEGTRSEACGPAAASPKTAVAGIATRLVTRPPAAA